MFTAVISRLGQAVSGETTLDEAYNRIDTNIAQQIADRKNRQHRLAAVQRLDLGLLIHTQNDGALRW